jgi:SAM-dependent methyltransferase
MESAALHDALAEQQRYYRALAPDYHRAVMPDRSEDADATEREVTAAVERYCHGDVLELACGPGTWTSMLARCARSVLCVDGASEMLAIAAASNPGENVSFLHADIFAWRPPARYDAVFFGFWLSHVPEELFAGFWEQIAGSLADGGRVLFVDDAYRPDDELAYGEKSSMIRRVLKNGSGHRIVKADHTAAELGARLAQLGWDFRMHEHGRYFWGSGAPFASAPD